MIRALLILLFLSPTLVLAEGETYVAQKPIVFQPEIPPADAYEVMIDMFFGLIQSEEVGEILACVVVLKAVEWPSDRSIPLDLDGYPMIKLDDGMTFLTADAIIEEIDPETCDFYGYRGS